MGKRQACLAALLFAALALSVHPGLARADQARSVGYVLGFRLGVESEAARKLVDELAKATTEWHGQSARQGEPVAKDCHASRTCVYEAASALGASRLGIVAIVAAGGMVRLDVRLMDPNTGSEIQRTHTQYESSAGAPKAERAIFDLIPRLLPGEKAAPAVVAPPDKKEPEVAKSPVQVPPVAQIPAEPQPDNMNLSSSAPPRDTDTRWWLWGGLGAAATVAIVAGAILVTRDDAPSGPVLVLPPPS